LFGGWRGACVSRLCFPLTFSRYSMSNLPNPFNTLQTLSVGGTSHRYYSLPALETAGYRISRLPVSIRLVLESLLRNCDGKRVAEHAVKALAGWQPNAPRTEEVPFVVARIVLQDFTGVPLLVDLAAMRSAVERLGKNPKIIEPLVPVDLVVDHSVQVDFAGSPTALQQNLDLEFKRNRERYQFLKWGIRPSTRSRSCRPASASFIRSTWNIWRRACSVSSRASFIRIRSSAPIRTRR
jgi:aconitate hydratase